MAAMLKLATLAILSFVVIVAPLTADAAFIPYDYTTTFYWCCRDYIESGNDCALDYACCPTIDTISSKVSKSNTKDEISYACLGMKSALSRMKYNYNNTVAMVAKCGSSLPFDVALGAKCY
ncbi:hypothetical protein Droror1_Dr00009014 [Drosera rotundifolia]